MSDDEHLEGVVTGEGGVGEGGVGHGTGGVALLQPLLYGASLVREPVCRKHRNTKGWSVGRALYPYGGHIVSLSIIHSVSNQVSQSVSQWTSQVSK